MLNKAIQRASTLSPKKYRIYSIVTDKHGKIISTGTNSFSKSHTRQAYYAEKVGQKNRIKLHSEIDAIIKANGEGYAIYTARVDKKGNPLPCAPCEICQCAIADSKIEEIYHT